jgi:endonuclease-3
MSCSTCGGAIPAQAVDTHIFRVGNRAGIAPGKDVDAVERAIEDNVPAEFQRHAHHWLILHGRYTCVARKPKCPACLIRDLCAFEDKTPEPPAKPAKRTPA